MESQGFDASSFSADVNVDMNALPLELALCSQMRTGFLLTTLMGSAV